MKLEKAISFLNRPVWIVKWNYLLQPF